jgi:hypothetical protein
MEGVTTELCRQMSVSVYDENDECNIYVIHPVMLSHNYKAYQHASVVPINQSINQLIN